jgi:uncharacterized protein
VALRDPAILEHTLTPGQRRVLFDLASRLKQHYGERLERVVVFGSRARGDVTENSDIDVLLLLRIPAEEEDRETSAAWKLLDQAWAQAKHEHVPISFVVFSEERFREMRDRERRFALDVEKEGIRV